MSPSLYPHFHFLVSSATGSGVGRARRGRLTTPHGSLETPAFIFCATKAAMKAVMVQDLTPLGTQIILSNTYHLMLNPGSERVEALGRLHQFIGWRGPMLTDSGGFQIFSLGHGSVADEIKGRRLTHRPTTLLKISEDGARFRSYVNGQIFELTPEHSMKVQRELGADLVVCLDECTPFHISKDKTARSMRRSHRWEMRSLDAFITHNDGRQALYGIIQGGVYPDLRQESVDFVNNHPFFGHAVGGSLGADKSQMYTVVHETTEKLDPSRPIHLLGIGGIDDIFEGVEASIDTFDCVHPTRLARHGGALIKGGTLSLRGAARALESEPIEEGCPCPACVRPLSRGYLHYLFKAQEMVAFSYLTLHNISFMNRLMAAIREGLELGTYHEVKKQWLIPQKN